MFNILEKMVDLLNPPVQPTPPLKNSTDTPTRTTVNMLRVCAVMKQGIDQKKASNIKNVSDETMATIHEEKKKTSPLLESRTESTKIEANSIKSSFKELYDTGDDLLKEYVEMEMNPLATTLRKACASANGARPSVPRAFMYPLVFLRVSF